MDSITSLKKSRFPIVSVSNMTPPEEIQPLVDNCLVGENEECRYQDFFKDEEIDQARNSSKYLLHFTPPDNITISYKSFSYGRGSTYHWSTLSQLLKIIKYSREKEFTHFLIIEGDTILEGEDIPVISDIFLQMERENLDFVVSMQQNMGHMSGNAWFSTLSYWEKVCFGMSKGDFLKSTYPSFSCEGYMVSRMKNVGGRGNVIMWDPDFYPVEGFPERWKIIKKMIPNDGLHRSINLFFPRTKEIGLSSSIERNDQSPSDPLSYVWMGTGKRDGSPVFFIWNRYNGETVKKTVIKVTIYNSENQIFSSEYNLYPGGWCWTPVLDLELESRCIVEISVTDKKDNIFNYMDKFGYIGNL
jgi:hypothetical protein